MCFIYNLKLFICNLVTKSTKPHFQQSHFSFRNTIKCYICTQWKTHISIQKHHTGSTQQLFPFSCFAGSYGNGAWSKVNPEQLSDKQDRAGGTGSCHRADRHQDKGSENNLFWESLELHWSQNGRKEQNLNGNEIPSNKAKLQVGQLKSYTERPSV